MVVKLCTQALLVHGQVTIWLARDAVVKNAYIAAADHYTAVEELPSGRGLTNVVYLPKRGDASPALIYRQLLFANKRRPADLPTAFCKKSATRPFTDN